MQAILLSSRQTGMTGWAAVREGQLLRVTGMGDGDLMRVRLQSTSPLHVFPIDEDGDYKLPIGTVRVQVEHIRASGASVCVDLVQGNGGYDDAA